MDDVPEGFDIEALLAPFEGIPAAGRDLRLDLSPHSLYFRLRDARSEARAEEREADKNAIDIPPPAQWRIVRQLALEAIGDRSKDLEIAAWLAEAALRLDGLSGFAAVARLMDGLAARYWDDLHPLPDEEGMETRVAPITGLNGSGGDGTLVQPLRKIVLFNRRDGAPLAFWEYEQSAQAEGLNEADRAQRHAAGIPVFSDVEADARATRPAAHAAMRQKATAALAAWTELGARLDALAGADSPPTSRVRELLAQLRRISDTYAPADVDIGSEPALTEAPHMSESEVGAAALGPRAAGGATQPTRDDMLRELSRIADYFRRTEPHSPLAYTLEEAVRRGRMTWPELLEEVLPDMDSRNQVLSKLGIRPVEAPE